MAEGETRSLYQIRRETEATRAGLTSTVDQLRSTVSDTATEIRDRLRPEAIKAEVSNYFKSRGEQLVSNVKQAARRNPMQAVVVGASVAYPLLRIARAIPVPVLMIGAGLFFAGSKTGRDLTQQASDTANDLVDRVQRQTHDLTDRIAGATADAQSYAYDAFRGSDGVTGISSDAAAKLQPIRDITQTAVRSVTDGVSDMQDRAAALASNATASAQDRIAGISFALSQTAADGMQAGQNFVESARGRLAGTSDRASRAMSSTIEQNPLLVAGVGLLLGGLIASVLPKLDAEGALMGEASSAVKKRAHEAAAAATGLVGCFRTESRYLASRAKNFGLFFDRKALGHRQYPDVGGAAF